MGWTEDRVEMLKRLWLDGLSASQIAKHLGGVTRNAVIGKVHRLGLSGRAAPSQPVDTVFKAPRPPRQPAAGRGAAEAVELAEPAVEAPIAEAPIAEAPTAEAPVVEVPMADVPMAEAPPVEAAEAAAPAEPAPADPVAPVVIPEPPPEPAPAVLAVSEPEPGPVPPVSPVQSLTPHRGGATVLTLGARMCKWPIGDPSSAEFSFCGRRSSEEGPYCVEHARVAYQPQPTRKKAPGAEPARSLRRHV